MKEFAGNAPIYFDPSSPRDLAEKLASVLNDPRRMKDLGEKAERQSQKFDWTSSARITWQSIVAVAGG
jgi:glycosyltransferase involved in cell wall biosynthesis